MKVTVIGGGSTYTPELVNGFLARRESLPVDELWLMDIDGERLDVVGGFAKRMVEAKGAPFKVVLTTDQREAVRGATYVSTQLRVGKMPARIADEYLGRRHGLVGQETTGVGGMAKALRTIPVALGIAKDVREVAPGALIVNFTNPSGLITQALHNFAPDVASVGVCNAPFGIKMGIIEGLSERMGVEIPYERAELKGLGLNHLSWYTGFTFDGEDLWKQVFQAYVEELRKEEHHGFDPNTIEALGMIPNYYLHYFYDTRAVVASQEKWPPSRGETALSIEQDLLRQYADPTLLEPPADLMKRGGAHYSTVATQLMSSHYNNLGETHIVNTRHNGAVEGWPKDWVLEMPCRIDRAGIHPLPVEPLPPAAFGLLAQVKAYELLTAEAGKTGDRRLAYQALLTNPLGPDAGQVQAVLDDLLETHRANLPLFWA